MKNKGFTLIELVITLAVFSVLIIATSGVAVSAIKSQRKFFAMQATQESTRYILESMSKEIRMSQIVSPTGNSSSLQIINPNNEDIDYRFISNKIQRRVDSGTWQDLSSANLTTTGNFYIRKSDFPSRAVITIVMKVMSIGTKAEEQSEIQLQSSVTSRSY